MARIIKYERGEVANVAGWDDPRYVGQSFAKLEGRVAKIEKAVMPFALHQRGPLPGYMRAVAINDRGQASSMWANYTNIGPGSGPYSAVTDANAVIRAEWGSLAANGVSPQQYGFRANDASGAPIFDSLGLIHTTDLLATDTPGAQTAAGSGTGFGTVQTVPGSGSNFTCPRSGKILCTSTLSWVNTAGAVNYVAIYFGIWTQAGSLVQRARVSGAGTLQNNNYFMNPTNVFVGLTPSAALQFRLEFALDAATTGCGFGTGATGIPPDSQVIALGS